jgi:hypothetical protein
VSRWCDGNKTKWYIILSDLKRRQPTHVWNVVLLFWEFLFDSRRSMRAKEMRNLMNQLSDTLKVIDGSSKDNFELFLGYGKVEFIVGIISMIPRPHRWMRTNLFRRRRLGKSSASRWIIKSSSLIKIKSPNTQQTKRLLKFIKIKIVEVFVSL